MTATSRPTPTTSTRSKSAMKRSQEVARHLTDQLRARTDAPTANPDFWQAVYYAARDAYEAGQEDAQNSP
jgi:hypothetical protein